MKNKIKLLALASAALLLTTKAEADNTIFQPTIFSTGSSLTINSGITVNFLSGSIVDFNAGSSVDFTGATVTGLATGGAPTTATYITQTSDATLSAEQALSALATGLMKVTTSTGVITSITDNSANWDTAFTQTRQWDGGSTGLVAATGRTSLGATTVGSNFFTATNPSAITFPKVSAVNAVTFEDAATHRASIGAGTGNGTVTNIATTAPVQGGAITTTGTISLNLATDFAFTTNQTITLSNAATNTSDSVFRLEHATSGTATTNFGTTIWIRNENGGGTMVDAGQIQNNWSTATAASETSYYDFQLRNAGAALASRMRLHGSSGLSVGHTTDPGSGFVSAQTGFKIGATNIFPLPTANGGVPAGGAADTVLTKNTATDYDAGWRAQTLLIENASTTTQTITTADTYITGSSCVVGAGKWAAGGQYKCRFEITKTALGTATWALNVRVGTAGTTSDTLIIGGNLLTQTAAVDTMMVDLNVNIRSSGASATSAGNVLLTHTAANSVGYGLTAPVNIATLAQVATFNSTTATTIGVSFNGGASHSGTVTVVQASYMQ